MKGIGPEEISLLPFAPCHLPFALCLAPIVNMIDLEDNNIDQILVEFSSEELINLSEDLLKIAIELTLHDDLDLPDLDSVAKGNDLLVIIPKVIASRLNKAETYSQKFASFRHEDLVFAGYSIEELHAIRKLLEDVIWLVEHYPRDALYREVFEELKDNFELDAEVYRRALKNVNEAYRIQSRHLMTNAIRAYKDVITYSFDHFLHESPSTLEKYREHLSHAVDLLETSEMREKYASQLRGLTKTLILILEALNTHTIGSGFSKKKLSYIQEILYHIRHAPEEYIFEVIRRFAMISREKVLLSYMSPEEIAVRYRTRYIKHNRVLLSFISNPVEVKQDFILEVINTVLQNLSLALNVKLQFIRTGIICDQIIQMAPTDLLDTLPPYSQEELRQAYQKVHAILTILEKYTINSDYLETLQEKCYRVSLITLQWFETDQLLEIGNIQRRYQIYAARRLFVLRISTLCLVIFSHSAEQLALMASERILTVCRDLIQFKYDFLKPSSIYLESMFDLDFYRAPVLSKIETALERIRSNLPPQTVERLPLSEDFAESSLSGAFASDHDMASQFKPFFSQLVINCLALKVQELDRPPEVISKETSLDREEIQEQISSSRERIEYFLKQHQEEQQRFLEFYQRSEIDQRENSFQEQTGNSET
ncbi:hypothetical protein U27_00312 [Candidatus Vecturithrix granuli]|uniref:Uncharacterized protein n=1 Tax=Vecturithrix granuli TaxID=1499967 RepID=A0A081C760_VECG1|nr:hypothetical protein U27_00312 [Candidatus Vecturithrix granuli]